MVWSSEGLLARCAYWITAVTASTLMPSESASGLAQVAVLQTSGARMTFVSALSAISDKVI